VLKPLEGMLSRWSRLHLQSFTNLYWARVVGYGPLSLCVIHKKGLYPSSGDINRLMMNLRLCYFKLYDIVMEFFICESLTVLNRLMRFLIIYRLYQKFKEDNFLYSLNKNYKTSLFNTWQSRNNAYCCGTDLIHNTFVGNV
jgi:hypothetical protein